MMRFWTYDKAPTPGTHDEIAPATCRSAEGLDLDYKVK
jgi:hypothetical protein